jgi:hypothetical protein
MTVIFTYAQKHLGAVFLLLILITSANLCIAEAAETPQPLATLRKPATPCGLYLSQLNNGTGIKVADLNETSIEAFFASHPDLEATISVVDSKNLKPFDDFEALKKAVVDGRTKSEKKERYLFLVGLPWPKSQSQKIVDFVNEKVAAENFDFPPKVIALRKPSSTGIARVKEEMVYLLVPFASDAAPSTPDEIKLGMQSVAISSGITIATQTVMQGVSVGLPASAFSEKIPPPILGPKLIPNCCNIGLRARKTVITAANNKVYSTIVCPLLLERIFLFSFSKNCIYMLQATSV